jgi:hypothetical protein
MRNYFLFEMKKYCPGPSSAALQLWKECGPMMWVVAKRERRKYIYCSE